MKHFTFSFVFTAVALALVGMWGFHLNGVSGALAAVTLAAVLVGVAVLTYLLSRHWAFLGGSPAR